MADTCSLDLFNDLRQRFKSLSAETNQQHQNWQIRVHRSLSWLERAIETDPVEQPDARLLFGWISFNSLYGRWDEQAGFPAADREAWQDFLRVVLAQDGNELVAAQIRQLRDPILELLENKFVDLNFWRNPEAPGNTRRRYHEALSMYVERRWLSLAIFAFERIYVFRGQLVHGAATRGSELNRRTLLQSREVLEGLLLPIQKVVIEHGYHDDWPPLCYPPIRTEKVGQAAPKPNHRPR